MFNYGITTYTITIAQEPYSRIPADIIMQKRSSEDDVEDDMAAKRGKYEYALSTVPEVSNKLMIPLEVNY